MQKIVIVGAFDTGITTLERYLNETSIKCITNRYDRFKNVTRIITVELGENKYELWDDHRHSGTNMRDENPSEFYYKTDICIIIGDVFPGRNEKEYFENYQKTILKYAPSCRFINVMNKMDIVLHKSETGLPRYMAPNAIPISFKTGQGLGKLIFAIVDKQEINSHL